MSEYRQLLKSIESFVAFYSQALKDELQIKDEIIKSLLSRTEQPENEADLKTLKGNVISQLFSLKELITKKEEALKQLANKRKYCDDEIEKGLEWLKNAVNEFPDMQNESLEDTLIGSQKVLELIEEKGPWVSSIIEKVEHIVKDLPKEERNILERKLNELKICYAEIKRQGTDHVEDLLIRTGEKRKVRPF